MNTNQKYIRHRNFVAKVLPRLHGGPHRSRPTRADFKRELRRDLTETNCARNHS